MARRDRYSSHLRSLAMGTLVAIAVGGLAGQSPRVSWAAAYLLGINAATFVLYGYDKHAASRGGPRVPENMLHLFALVGGTPGAYLGQRVFRHKTVKRKFRAVFWAVAAAQLALLLWWLRAQA